MSRIDENLRAERLRVAERIRELERLGEFGTDAEDDPPTVPLKPEDITYLDSSLGQKMRTRFAFFTAYSFFCLQRLKGIIALGEPIGLENLKEAGAAVITCNHFSPLDSFIMQWVFDKSKKNGVMHRIIREGNYTSFPGFYGFLMRNCNTLPLARDIHCAAKLSRAIGDVFSRGDSLLIYPEGSLWWNYRKPKPTKSGAFDIAIRHGVPVVPIFIAQEDTKKQLPDGSHAQKYTPVVGKPIYPDLALPKKEASKKLSELHFEFWRGAYENFYKTPLSYDTHPDGAAIKKI